MAGFVQNLFPGVVLGVDPFLLLCARNACTIGLPGASLCGLIVCFDEFGRESELMLEAGNECRSKTSGSRAGGPEGFVLTRFRGLEDSLREPRVGDPNDSRGWALEQPAFF